MTEGADGPAPDEGEGGTAADDVGCIDVVGEAGVVVGRVREKELELIIDVGLRRAGGGAGGAVGGGDEERRSD